MHFFLKDLPNFKNFASVNLKIEYEGLVLSSTWHEVCNYVKTLKWPIRADFLLKAYLENNFSENC